MHHFIDSDDWLEVINKLEYAEENLADLPRKEFVRRKEAKIMRILRINSDTGVSHIELARTVQIDRKNLSPYMKRLMKKGLVKRGKGKQGKYYPSIKRYREPIVAADLFGKAAIERILAEEEFPVDSSFFKNNSNNGPFEYALFKFSNKIGAIITYLLIQSMDPSNKIIEEGKDDEEKDLNVKRWMDDAVSSFLPHLLPIFKELIVSLFHNFKSLYEDYYDSNGSLDLHGGAVRSLGYAFKRPFYTLDHKFISELVTAFTNSYPSLASGLDKIKAQLPMDVAKQVSRWEYEAYRSQQQTICKHNYKKLTNLYLPIKSKHNLIHCSKCHKTKYKMNHL